MKNFLFKSSLMCLLLAFFVGCNEPDVPGVGNFNLELKTVGEDYVEVYVTAPYAVELAYMVTEKPRVLAAAVIFKSGTSIVVSPGQTVRISRELFHNTEYCLYLVAKLSDMKYSEIAEFKFRTLEYQHTDLVTIVDTYNNGYKAFIKVPQGTKDRGNVIRYSGTSLAWYNVLSARYGSSEEVDLMSIAMNGDPYGQYVKNIRRDTTLVMDDDNTVAIDENGNPVKDDLTNDYITLHDPIVPGEPYVFIAGECKKGDSGDLEDVLGFVSTFEGETYIIPVMEPITAMVKDTTWLDEDKTIIDKVEEKLDTVSWNWTGPHQKVEFMMQEPSLCDATVDIEISDISAVDATINFTMSEGVVRYFYMILDNATYNGILSEYLGGKEEYFQWFLTSYLAAVEWGCVHQTENLEVQAAASFSEGALEGNGKYHVLCTVQGDEKGMTQRYIHKEFTAAKKVLDAPVVEIKAVNTGDPFTATFNIKAPNKDLKFAYWACNYAREFQLMLNANHTYETIVKGNYYMPSEELALINSDKGFDLTVSTLDGEVTRFVLYGYNAEHTYNKIDPKKEGVGWADYEAPMAKKDPKISSPLFKELVGDWTATATIKVNEMLDNDDIVAVEREHKSKVTISASAPELPAAVEEHVYELYTKNSREDVDGMFEELKILSDRFTEYRLAGQNRLLCTGFMDFDYYTEGNGRMIYMSPYDLFKDADYSSVDVPQLMYDFGPKWFLELIEDKNGNVEVVVPFHSLQLPPMHAWPGYPFYVGGVGEGGAFYDSVEGTPGFPVEIEDDYSKITIKPIIRQTPYYMNALGMTGNTGQMELVATVVSDIVLTREPIVEDTAPVVSAPSQVRAVDMNGAPVKELPKARKFKSMTKLVEPKTYKVDENPNVVTMEMVNATTEKILKHYNLK